MNHGITAGGVDNTKLGAGMGEFIDKYIFPGGELTHISNVLHRMTEGGLEDLTRKIFGHITLARYGLGATA